MNRHEVFGAVCGLSLMALCVAGVKYFFYVDDEGDPDDPYEIPGLWSTDNWQRKIETLAESAADEYHSCYDGWESSWPLLFVILDVDGKEIGRANVERESCPVFSARTA